MANISDFVSKLKGGGARANQFKVTLPFPGFASTGGETESMAFLCSSTQLPASTLGEITIPFRGRNVYLAGDREFAELHDRCRQSWPSIHILPRFRGNH